MAVLVRRDSSRFVSLAARTLVGRRSASQLQLDPSYVGREHAVISYGVDGWRVRDLASQNGTFLDGSRLKPGLEYEFEAGMVVCFGDKIEAWEMTKDGPPEPAAVGPKGEIVVGEGRSLVLPSAERKEVELMVEQDPDGVHWQAYRDEEGTPVRDQTSISAGGQEWRLLLPSNLEVGTSTVQGTMAGTRIVLRTNKDETELYEVRAIVDGKAPTSVKPQKVWRLALVLAKDRLEHEASGKRPDEIWLSVRRVCRRLGIEQEDFPLTLHRARHYLGKAGVPDAPRVMAQRVQNGVREVSLQGCTVEIEHS